VTLRITSTCMKLVHPPPNESLGESTDSRSFGRFNGAALILIRGHVYAVGFAEDPPVDSSDEAGRPTPQHAGALSHRMDGRDDSEAVAGPFAGGTRLEHPIDMRVGDVSLPGRPAVDVGVQPPDCAEAIARLSVSHID
jgi:hypothetical protein